ncbi:5-hydroxyisourate hydrolase [Nocardioides zeae]|uniref:5-hydroxyisourate hydrolase n=2 Tax=Nocardioides zeae TaxID=1457234 RepID=A0AAJ1X0T9_9ACTN|nr:hydroxyisourate hydrolase [Nocardioides zeae]MDQ1104903.1 5-hydroxyisourate hydrolase [Nocardioides zeae]MDR6175383.1 5-hydroxyisourate hydrolase [Nocardioides zeae]MDR6208316.1 5-hydroxyisourate hydrolase [Nocardioides zeae]
MTTCSTHVLDAARGVPAAGLDVTLATPAGTTLATATTDADGRIRWDGPLVAAGGTAQLDPATYVVSFATGDWYAAAGRDTFFPHVDLTVALHGAHVHVALLLSPYAYTTYQGS